MKVFVAGVSSERQFVASLNSFHELKIRDGDEKAINFRARGDVARITLCNEFLANEQFDAIYLTDLDMKYPVSVLERLRSHDLDMVTGHYFKRQPSPMQSVVSVSSDGTWPYMPLVDIPEDGLHEVACAGMGNVLIKRKVIEAVIEQLRPGEHPFSIGPMPEMVHGDHGSFGADFRFFTLARRSGYTFWLDAHPDAEAKHASLIWLGRELYKKLGGYKQAAKNDKYWEEIWKQNARLHGMNAKTAWARIQKLQFRRVEAVAALEAAEQDVEDCKLQLAVIDGQIVEREIDVKATNLLPEGAQKLNVPVFASEEEAEAALAKRGKGPKGETAEEAEELRRPVFQESAMEYVETLDERETD